MIGIGMSIQIKKSKVLTDSARVLALPLVEMLQLLDARIMARLARGQGPNGPWNSYASNANLNLKSPGPTQGPTNLFWVAPTKPQPGSPGEGGFRFRVPSGKWTGWAVYDDVRTYYRLRGMLDHPHDFEETGELKSRRMIRIVSARHVRLAFFGGHKSGMSAKQLGWLVSKDERDPLFMPSRAEVQEAQALMVGRINEAIARAGAQSEQAQRLSGQVLATGKRSINRRVSRLLGD